VGAVVDFNQVNLTCSAQSSLACLSFIGVTILGHLHKPLNRIAFCADATTRAINARTLAVPLYENPLVHVEYTRDAKRQYVSIHCPLR